MIYIVRPYAWCLANNSDIYKQKKREKSAKHVTPSNISEEKLQYQTWKGILNKEVLRSTEKYIISKNINSLSNTEENVRQSFTDVPAHHLLFLSKLNQIFKSNIDTFKR